MPNLFDMLNDAQGGNGIDLLARQFDLSRQQAELALEALLPAFSQGLKRNVSDPYGVANFIGALASGQHGQYFDQASRAFSADAVDNGNDVLGQLFGSKELSRAVAAQAAQATGIGQDVLKRMLPVIASMLMGGMLRQWTGQSKTGQAQAGQAAGGFGAGNPLGEIIEKMMRQGGAGMPQQRTQPQASPSDNPFGDILKDMFGGGAASREAPRPSPGGIDNPFGRMFEEMLGGSAPPPESKPGRDQPDANPGGRPRSPFDDIFGDMFETGRKTRDDYEQGVKNVFDQFMKGMDRHR